MKHSLHFQKRFLSFLVALVMGTGTVFAADFSAVCSTGQTLYYNITDATNHYVEITYPGTFSSPWGGFTKPTGNITLPSTVTYNGITYTVKAIGARAFYMCSGLTGSLTIPNSVTTIGLTAFRECRGLTGSLTIPNSVTSIDVAAFAYCGFTGSLTIPNSVTTIGDDAFDGCRGFTGSLTIPNFVTTIGSYAFRDCTGLTGSLTIGSSVTTIGDTAFGSCFMVTSITVLPATPPTLGTDVFFNVPTDIPVYVHCSSLEDYQAASGWNAFTNMQCLDMLTYSINADGVSVTVTGHEDGTAATGPIVIPETKTIDGVTYTVTAIGNSAFEGCSGLTGTLTIPNSVNSIGTSAFSHCSGFTGSLTIPNSVTFLGGLAFQLCSGLTGSLTIPNTINSIGDYVFNGCYGFDGSLTIPASVTSIGMGAFASCSGFTSMIVLPENPPAIYDITFFDVPTTIPVYVPCQSLEDYQNHLRWSAFTNIQRLDDDCDHLTYSINDDGISVTVTGHVDGTAATGELVIPETKTIDGVTYAVTAIGNSAFAYCSGLTGSLFLPKSLTSIGTGAFVNCTGFTGSLTILSSITEIGTSAFAGCNGFTSLTIPSSVTSIDDFAFALCRGLTSMTVLPGTPPTLGSNTFLNVSKTIPVHVPCAALEDYQNAEGWSAFTNYQCLGYDFSAECSTGQTLYYNIIDATNHYVEITYPGINSSNLWNGYSKPTGDITLPSAVTYNGVSYAVTTIGNHAFDGCSGLTGSLTIPNSVTAIGDFAFENCNGFTGSLTLSYSLTTIGTYAFYLCTGFTGSLTIPNSVTSIDSNAFFGLYRLTGSLTIGDAVTTISNSAFGACSGLSGSLTIGSSVASIGISAFSGCSGLTSMTVLPETPPSLGNNVFHNVPRDIPVYVPCGTLEDYQATLGSFFTHIYGNCLTFSINTDGVSVTVTGHVDGTSATGELFIPETTTIDGVTYTVTAISNGAFRNCSGLTGNLIIPNSVTMIGTQAFKDCIGLTSLTLSASVIEIKLVAFSGCTGLTTMTVLPATPPSLGSYAFRNVPTDIPVYVPCESLENYQSASGWSAFTNMQCLQELTVYDGSIPHNCIPANINRFDDFTRSQVVIPASDLAEMAGSSIISMTFYTLGANVPYITVCNTDVYLKEVDYTSISAYEPKTSATTVYSGRLSIVSAGSGGEMTIYFDTPYTYHGGNLLLGVENTEDNGRERIYFCGQTVNGASISGYNDSSTGTIPATQQHFIPKTTFSYVMGPKALPYTYGFEEEDEFFYCWTMLNCDGNAGRTESDHFKGDYGFLFWNTENPPQYLISPELECTTDVNVSFYYRNDGNAWPETFQVGYSTTTKSLSSFSWGDVLTAQNSTWTRYENTFPAGTRYVAIKHLSYDQNVFFLDEFSFTPAASSATQTTDLAEGWNWFSTYIEMDNPADLLLMLEESIGENGIQIKNADYYTAYEDEEWFGDLDDEGLFNEQMYKILVVDDCTVVLEGMKANPEDHGIDIEEGWNWIGFPVSEETAIEDAFADFDAEEGDVIKNSEDYTSFEDGEWFGDLEDMTPGQGYMYFSNSDESKTLIYHHNP